jgi:SAM-dependent methyltransferase
VEGAAKKMPVPETYSFTRYLSAKKRIDDRALNRQAWDSLSRALPPAGPGTPLHVLEIGAGTGAMFERMIDWGLLKYADYTALDVQAENIASARQALPQWAPLHGYHCQVNPAGSLVFTGEALKVSLQLEVIDIYDFIARHQGQKGWDLLIAHAFLDLLDIPAVLPRLFGLCRPSGLFYFTINFDGLTLLEPAIDPAFDMLIQNLYHRTMDERTVNGRPSGDSRAGRHLFGHVKDAGAEIIAAGASDWVVFPISQSYPQDEAYFLHFIVHTIHKTLAGHPGLDALHFERWVAERHAQIERGELVYIAHQLDFVGRVVRD